MSAERNYVEKKVHNYLLNQQRSEILQKIKEGISTDQIMKDYNISEATFYRIKRSADNINKLVKQETNLDRKKLSKYESLEKRLFKWFREQRESGDSIFYSQFKDEGLKLIDEFGGPKKLHAREVWLRACWTRFRNLLKCRNAPKSTENLAQSSDQVEQSAEKFVPTLIHRLEQEDIRRDNIYLMFRRKFTWRSLLPKTQKGTKEFDIQKLGNDGLIIIFCTNATGSSKLSPFYFYEYKTQESLKYLKNVEAISQILKTDILKHQQIFGDWYNNHFMKSVIEHQQKTNVSGKVLLLVTNCKECTYKECILSGNIMQNDDVEMMYLPRSCMSVNRSLINLIELNLIRFKFKEVSEDFCRSYDMNIYIKLICESWTNCITPAYIKSSLEKFLPDSRTEGNTTSTSLVKQTSKLIKNVTGEDTALMEIGSRKKKRTHKPIRNIGENKEEVAPKILKPMHEITKRDVPPDDRQNINSCGKDEGKEYQEQQENDINDKEITDRENTSQYFLNMMRDVMKERVPPDNLTEYFNSYPKIEGRKCQQLESTGRAENIQSVEDNFLNMMHDVIKKRVSPDNLTEYFNSYAKIEERKCQQLEITGRAENIQSVEENIESDPLDLDDKEIENI